MIERRLILEYHEGCSMMTLVEVVIFSADHSLAAVDLRSLESINSASVLKRLGDKTALVACKNGTGV